jgi:hypothetical protein
VKIEVRTSSRQPQNRTVWFPKLDHPVSAAPGQKRLSGATTLKTAPAPHWCPLGLTPSQRRRIQQMRAQKMREEATEKERDECFNIIRSMIPTKQEWRVKENVNTPAPTTANNDMDLLDDVVSRLVLRPNQMLIVSMPKIKLLYIWPEYKYKKTNVFIISYLITKTYYKSRKD